MSTPLHEASRWGHASVAKVLVEHGADINNKDIFGRTPRDLAASHGHADVVALLDEAGADRRPWEGTPMRLIFVDGANEDERQEFGISSSTALKLLFNKYAEKRGLSLRSLRFLHEGRTLFLSGGAGKKSPDELNMKDGDVITVHNTRRETSGGASETSRSSASRSKAKNAGPKNSARKRTRGKGNEKHTKQDKPEKTLEEHKAEHSKMLSKLHEEVEHRLKEIRTKLNALDLERQPPKERKKSKKKKNAARVDTSPQCLTDTGLGGRAGRSSFVVNVGEVQNLYRTAKASHRSQTSKFELDLHGHSREGALARLDESLKSWMDAAMGGSYPFTVQVTIVCGGGNQILEETVDGWIRTTKNVGNAPSRALR